MKRYLLVLALVLPFGVLAQQKNFDAYKNEKDGYFTSFSKWGNTLIFTDNYATRFIV